MSEVTLCATLVAAGAASAVGSSVQAARLAAGVGCRVCGCRVQGVWVQGAGCVGAGCRVQGVGCVGVGCRM
jgi:hypothetical protein